MFQLRLLQDPRVARDLIKGAQRLDAFQSEAYLDLALRKWLSMLISSRETREIFSTLGRSLMENHRDSWLRDFLNAPASKAANDALQAAIQANYKGDSKMARQESQRAKRIFLRVRNIPGVLRSQFEVAYAWRRQSKGRKCLGEISSALPLIRKASYAWLNTQVSLEKSTCQGMIGNLDQAWSSAEHVVQLAQDSHYPALYLRALGLLGSWHRLEGRLHESWLINIQGLNLFWSSLYPEERGFQYYSDLELAAEHADLWHLAFLLQSEALSRLEDTDRIDFKAIAHFHLAAAAESIHESEKARQEIARAARLFSSLPNSNATQFYRSESEIALAEIEIHAGAFLIAKKRLMAIEQAMGPIDNVAEELPYYKARAEVERGLGNTRAEIKDLNRAIEIGNKGFRNLRSENDRWQWHGQVDEIFRRRLEIEIQQTSDNAQTLADWESYRARESSRSLYLPSVSVKNLSMKRLLISRIHSLNHSTLLTFGVFRDWIVAWVADNRGIRIFRIPVSASALQAEVKTFYLLCSDARSPIEKIKGQGQRLYKWVFTPLESILEPRRSLLIESDGILNMIPWSALTTKDGTYLGQFYSLRNTPSLLSPRIRRRAHHVKYHVLIAFPGNVKLHGGYFPAPPHAEEESNFIATLFPGSVYLHNHQVTLEQLLKELQYASIFHFAGHAIIRQFGGELVIRNMHGDGDILAASKLLELKLTSTKLIVLAACSSASAELEPARDPRGLVTAFLNAGAERVVASRWDVDSRATAKLMQYFYGLLAKGSSIDLAFGVSTNRLRTLSSLSHPYYWAAFDSFGLH